MSRVVQLGVDVWLVDGGDRLIIGVLDTGSETGHWDIAGLLVLERGWD